jgi:hypothetical protein
MRRSRVPGLHGALMVSAIAFAAIANAHGEPTPDFGPNVTIIDPSMPVDQINAKLRSLAARSTGFDEVRSAVYFMPGTYGSAAAENSPATATGIIDSPVGFVETVQGLGASPDDVTINGNLRVGTPTGIALGTFWRSLENVRINPIEADEAPHAMRWNTSQACPLRRVDILGNLDLAGGVAGGNLIANSRVAGVVSAGFNWVTDPVPRAGQFYYYIHDSQIGTWQGHWINYVFSGVVGAPATRFNPGDVTSLERTPIAREPPFLYVDHHAFNVFVPNARTGVRGIHWGTRSCANEQGDQGRGVCDGVTLPLDRFFIARPSDSAETINEELRRGKNLILTPGVYKVSEAVHVVRPNTVIMGMGLATVTPINGTAAVQVDDVPGVSISAITVDANTANSAVLVQIGTPDRSRRSSDHPEDNRNNPTTISDLFVRLGGTYRGRATTSLDINQDNVLIDHAWLWRADHGNKGTVGWTINSADHGLVVNGNHVTALGLFVEHYQKTQVVWNGNAGRTVFLQSEAPYDPPNQAAYMNGSEDGYPFYEVAREVTSHEAIGITAQTLFLSSRSPIYIESAYKAPQSPHVRFGHLFAGVLLGSGGIRNIINEAGGSALAVGGPPPFVSGVKATTQLSSYP